MKTLDIYNENEILMFHICGGGGNRRRLEFKGSEKITNCHTWETLFASNRDERGRFCAEYLHDCNGNPIMDSEELKEAMSTGMGCLNIDGDCDTTYTSYLKDLSEAEYQAIDEDWQKIYQIVINEVPEDKLGGVLEDEDLDNMFYYQFKG